MNGKRQRISTLAKQGTASRPAGPYQYKTVSLARQQRNEVLCTHCNDVMSRQQLRQHFEFWWDDDADQWRLVRDGGRYATPLPLRVEAQHKPYVILGMRSTVSVLY